MPHIEDISKPAPRGKINFYSLSGLTLFSGVLSQALAEANPYEKHSSFQTSDNHIWGLICQQGVLYFHLNQHLSRQLVSNRLNAEAIFTAIPLLWQRFTRWYMKWKHFMAGMGGLKGLSPHLVPVRSHWNSVSYNTIVSWFPSFGTFSFSLFFLGLNCCGQDVQRTCLWQ